MSTVATHLIDARTGESTAALLHTKLSPEQILEVERVWGPARVDAILGLMAQGTRLEDLPEHAHWNWANKLTGCDRPSCRFTGVECEGTMQGLMRLKIAGEVARLPPDTGEPLVYVEFLETAPWNTRVFTSAPRFKGTGLRLIEAAVRLSAELAFHGRVGLHALPQAAGFYTGACGMTPLDLDPTHEMLLYLELGRDGAAQLMQGETNT